MTTFLSAFISWDGCEYSVCVCVCKSACCCLHALPVQGFLLMAQITLGAKGMEESRSATLHCCSHSAVIQFCRLRWISEALKGFTGEQ